MSAESNARDIELAHQVDAEILAITEQEGSWEEAGERIRERLAQVFAAYREEVSAPLYAKANAIPGLTAELAMARDSQEVLARDPGFVLPAAEHLLKKAGVDLIRVHEHGVDLESRGPGGATGHCCFDETLALAYQGLVDGRKGRGHG